MKTRNNIYKKTALFITIFLFALGSSVYALAPVTLDQAIRSSAEQIETRLARGSRVVILSFDSPSERLARYALDEMMTGLGREGPVQRKYLPLQWITYF
jgi:hypothetical protein